MHPAFKKPILRYAGAVGTILAFLITVLTVIGLVQGAHWLTASANSLILNGCYCFIILLLLWIILEWKPKDYLASPKIRTILDEGILVSGSSPWLGIGASIAVYAKEDEFERLVCAGKVINAQTNGLIQIQLLPIQPKQEPIDIVEKLKPRLSDIIIRPGLHQ